MSALFPFMMVMGETYSVAMPESVSYFASTTGTTAYSGIQIDNDGRIKEYRNGSYIFDDPWLEYGVNSGFEVMCTKEEGSPVYGAAVDTWLDLATDRLWYVLDTTTSPATVSTALLTISIRKGGTVLDTMAATITANKTS